MAERRACMTAYCRSRSANQRFDLLPRRASIILGFAADLLCKMDPRYKDNCLIYVARVTKNLDGREYFSKRRYAARPDCIYRWRLGRFAWKRGSQFHSPNSLTHDLGGAPEYRRANVLLSEGASNFRHFGYTCPVLYKNECPQLKSLIDKLEQGHRVNYVPQLRAELQELLRQLWKKHSVHRYTPQSDAASCKHICDSGKDCLAELEC